MKAMNNPTMTTTPPKLKIAAKLITIDRAEGPNALCTETTHETWKSAEERISRICQSAPKNGGYDKCDFKVVFLDGEEYEGRYDAAHPESKAFEGTLAKHIRDHLEFYAGLRRPDHISEADYDRLLKECAERGNPTSKYLDFLKAYALEDLMVTLIPPAPDATIQTPKPTAPTAWRVITGNTYPAKGLLSLLGGKWNPDAKQWSVPAEKFAEAQAAVDRFNPPPKAVDMSVEARRAAFAATPKPVVATTPPKAATKPKPRKGPKLPPTALERRLESLLTGAKAIHDSIPAGDAIRPQLDFAIGHIQEALDRLTKGA